MLLFATCLLGAFIIKSAFNEVGSDDDDDNTSGGMMIPSYNPV